MMSPRSQLVSLQGFSVFALAVALLALCGCGLSVVGHRIDPFGGASKAKAAPSQDRFAEAREQSALAPEEPYWPYRLAEMYVETDSIPNAEMALRTSLQRDPSYVPALALLSKLYFQSRRHTEAAQMLEAARARTNSFPSGFPPVLLAGLALHYEALGQADRSGTAMNQMPRSDGRDVESALVYLKLRSSNPDTATTLARSTLDHDSDSAANQNNYGITRLRAGDAEAARKAFLKAIELDKTLPGHYYNLAILEKFYTLDDQASARWFALYRERATEDPDGLAELGTPGVAGKKD